MSETLSVIVATYNAEEGLKRTLKSVAQQRGFDSSRVEFLLIDGGSRDKTVQLARDSGLFEHVLSERDRGVYDAMNKGAAIASHRWLHFLNAGDELLGHDAIATILAASELARSDGNRWFVLGARNASAGGTQIRNLPHRWLPHALGLQPHCHQSSFFDAQLFSVLGGYSLDFGTAGDFDLIMRAGLVSKPTENRATVITYEGSGMSDKGPRENIRVQRSVRLERWQIFGAFRYAEGAASVAVLLANWARIKAGALKRFVSGRLSSASG